MKSFSNEVFERKQNARKTPLSKTAAAKRTPVPIRPRRAAPRKAGEQDMKLSILTYNTLFAGDDGVDDRRARVQVDLIKRFAATAGA